MEDFLHYKKLQCMLLSMDSEDKINDIEAYIDKNHLFDHQHTLSTLKLISSVVFANPRYLNNAVKLLKTYENIGITNPLFIGYYPGEEVLERSQMLYALLWISNHISYNSLQKYHCPNVLKNIMEFIDKVSPEKNLEKEEKKSLDDLIFQSILNDDVDSLQNLVLKNKIDINKPIKINYWIPSIQSDNSLPIEYSIVLASIKCFKFLLSSTEKVDYSNLFLLAIQGKNMEIYNIIEQKIDLSYMPSDYLKYAILFMNNELFDYFTQKIDCHVGTNDIIDCIYSSNYYAMLSLKKFKIYSIMNMIGKNGSTPIDTAAFEGDLYFVKYLAEILRVNTHALNSYGKTILQSAVKSNQMEIVKYIIKNNLVDIHDTGKWSLKPLDMAYFFGYKDMITYLNKIIFKNGRTCYGHGKIENDTDLNDTFYYKLDKND